MTDDHDQHDSNPYQSPAWSNEPTATNSGLVIEPIHLKGTLSLDEVLSAHGYGPEIANFLWSCFVLLISILGLSCAGIVVIYGHDSGGILGAVCLSTFFLPILGAGLRQSLRTDWLKRQWQEECGVFAYRELTITDGVIEMESVHMVTKTSWTDYAYYRRNGNTIWLYLSREGLKRRLDRLGEEERQARFRVNLHEIDIFPRLQFKDDADWERFQWAVKHRLKRTP